MTTSTKLCRIRGEAVKPGRTRSRGSDREHSRRGTVRQHKWRNHVRKREAKTAEPPDEHPHAGGKSIFRKSIFFFNPGGYKVWLVDQSESCIVGLGSHCVGAGKNKKFKP